MDRSVDLHLHPVLFLPFAGLLAIEQYILDI
jgi:hypothetical protein